MTTDSPPEGAAAPEKLHEDPETGEKVSKSERTRSTLRTLHAVVRLLMCNIVKRRMKQRDAQKKKAEKKVIAPLNSTKAKTDEKPEDELNPNVSQLQSPNVSMTLIDVSNTSRSGRDISINYERPKPQTRTHNPVHFLHI